MDSNSTVREIMTKEVISVTPETEILKAHEILSKNSLDGVPVVDENNILRGILTEYDLLFKDTLFHLPTFQKLFSEIKLDKRNDPQFQKDIEDLKNLRVKDVMNKEPLTLKENAAISEALEAFRTHHRVNPIPVVDDKNKVVGVISRFDILKVLNYL